jgi:hypothetical protein
VLVPPGDGYHQAKIGFDHSLLGPLVATFDALRELYLFSRRQQPATAHLAQVERE